MIFHEKNISLLGATGSMGQTLMRRILSDEWGKPLSIVAFSRDEEKQWEMKKEFKDKRIKYQIGDVRRYNDVVMAIRHADYVINTAALKQVPNCEYFPYQAMLTNCIGVHNIIKAVQSIKPKPLKVITISTDKACKPVNAYGISKALQEKLIIAANLSTTSTHFLAARYGNVLMSRGSVIPLFLEQIKAGGPVTVTHPDMTRFLLTLDVAVDTVMEALMYGQGGDIYIPICKSAMVTDLADVLIGDKSIEVILTGIRPGEKIDEILVSEEERHRTFRHGNYYVIHSPLQVGNIGKLDKEYCSRDHLLPKERLWAFLVDSRVL